MELEQKKGYRPYRSYQYLEAGRDYPVIDWAKWDWAGRHLIELSAEEEVRYRQIIAKYPYISVHEHPDFTPADLSLDSFLAAERQGRDACAYEALSYSNLDCIFDNLLDGTNIISSPGGWKWIDILHDLGMRLCDLAHQDFLVQCKTVDDILPRKTGQNAWCLHEGAQPIENEVDRIAFVTALASHWGCLL